MQKMEKLLLDELKPELRKVWMLVALVLFGLVGWGLGVAYWAHSGELLIATVLLVAGAVGLWRLIRYARAVNAGLMAQVQHAKRSARRAHR